MSFPGDPTILQASDPHTDVARLDEVWRRAPTFAFVPDPCPADRGWIAQVLRELPPALQEGHYALLTSGSTGRPKLVVGSRARSELLTRQMHARQALASMRATVLALPLTYSYAFVNQWLWGRVHGVELVPTPGLAQADALFRALDTTGPLMVCLVGAQVPLLERLLDAGRQFPQVARLNFAGGAFPQARLPWLHHVFPAAQVFNNYGCTEALPRLCIRAAAASDDPAWIGEPVEGVELREGPAQALEFRSPYGAVAVADEAGLRLLEPQDWVATGDLGTCTGSGWRLLGRDSEVFKRYGEKVSLAALLETVRAGWPGAAAFYLEGSAGETGHVLALAPAPSPEQVRALLQLFRKSHRRPHWPVRIEALDVLPLSANGKVDAAALAVHPQRNVVWRQIG